MNKKEIEKNYLDLLYQKNLQYLSVVLIVGVGSLIAFFSGLILNFDRWIEYSAILSILAILTYFYHKKTENNLEDISEKIKNLKVDEQ